MLKASACTSKSPSYHLNEGPLHIDNRYSLIRSNVFPYFPAALLPALQLHPLVLDEAEHPEHPLQLPPHPAHPPPESSRLNCLKVLRPAKNKATTSAIMTIAFPIIDAISHLLSLYKPHQTGITATMSLSFQTTLCCHLYSHLFSLALSGLVALAEDEV